QGSKAGDPEARYIQPGQGFFAEVTTTGATLQFTNAARVHNDLGPLDKKSTRVKPNSEVLIISLQKEDRSDKTYIGFRDGATKDFDGYYDAKKLLGNKANSYVFSYLDKDLSQKMAINAFPTPYDDEVVPLGLMINDEGDYSLSFSNMDSFEGQEVFFVKDVLLKKVYDLQEDSIISFTYYKGQPEHRFDLYFKDIQEEDALDYQFVVYVNNNRIYLYSLAEFDANTKVEIYNIVGQKVYEDVLANMENGIPVKWTSSYYVIRLQDANNFYSEKFFIP
ncbi:MAG: T9SS type A sorting domain-containing protein, partial [Bacteroidales bacterium]|nr:T9SS type A sorting domain-containing protein [Bacteroidales bacterium]